MSRAERARSIVERRRGGGLTRPSRSVFGPPIMPNYMADGSLRMCIDCRDLNEVTSKDVYPIPRQHEGRTHLDISSS
jgi:hypothetical protein